MIAPNAWEQITERYGRDSQKKLYAESLLTESGASGPDEPSIFLVHLGERHCFVAVRVSGRGAQVTQRSATLEAWQQIAGPSGRDGMPFSDNRVSTAYNMEPTNKAQARGERAFKYAMLGPAVLWVIAFHVFPNFFRAQL